MFHPQGVAQLIEFVLAGRSPGAVAKRTVGAWLIPPQGFVPSGPARRSKVAAGDFILAVVGKPF
ncbi:hypothetical protein, partial [Methylococcus capsulatus]|uniref:hypothetical protein n=1 Tax=Methylococcus capsulatus TaxID=414 RepID=UPI002405E5D2